MAIEHRFLSFASKDESCCILNDRQSIFEALYTQHLDEGQQHKPNDNSKMTLSVTTGPEWRQ